MNFFHSFLVVSAAKDLLSHALMATLHIEGVDNVLGAVSFTRKAKSIFKSWLARIIDNISLGEDPLVTCPIIIE